MRACVCVCVGGMWVGMCAGVGGRFSATSAGGGVGGRVGSREHAEWHSSQLQRGRCVDICGWG